MEMYQSNEKTERYENDTGSKKVKMDYNFLTGLPYSQKYYDILKTKEETSSMGRAKEQLLLLVQKYQVVIPSR